MKDLIKRNIDFTFKALIVGAIISAFYSNFSPYENCMKVSGHSFDFMKRCTDKTDW